MSSNTDIQLATAMPPSQTHTHRQTHGRGDAVPVLIYCTHYNTLLSVWHVSNCYAQRTNNNNQITTFFIFLRQETVVLSCVQYANCPLSSHFPFLCNLWLLQTVQTVSTMHVTRHTTLLTHTVYACCLQMSGSMSCNIARDSTNRYSSADTTADSWSKSTQLEIHRALVHSDDIMSLQSNYSSMVLRTLFGHITCSTVVLQCYRRQAIPMEQAKIRPSVTL